MACKPKSLGRKSELVILCIGKIKKIGLNGDHKEERER